MTDLKMVIIASGNGAEALAVIEAWKRGEISGVEVAALLTIKRGSKFLPKARELGVATYHSHSTDLLRMVRGYQPDLVLSTSCLYYDATLPALWLSNIDPTAVEQVVVGEADGLARIKSFLRKASLKVRRGKGEPDSFVFDASLFEITGPQQGQQLPEVLVPIPKELVEGSRAGDYKVVRSAERLVKTTLPLALISALGVARKN